MDGRQLGNHEPSSAMAQRRSGRGHSKLEGALATAVGMVASSRMHAFLHVLQVVRGLQRVRVCGSESAAPLARCKHI